MTISTYNIEGKNSEGQAGTWDIQAEDKDELLKIIEARGLQADKIDGKAAGRVKPKTMEDDDGV